MVATISPQELSSKPRDQFELIDVRTPAEYEEVHISYARNVPLDKLNPAEFKNLPEGKVLCVVCKSGSRGKQACEKLTQAGIGSVLNVEGGTEGAISAGLPVVRGKKTISLERQVRIAAGTLVVIGTVAGYYNPYWLILSGFVGCGLVFAGITDTCGMGMMLAKMPWNQRKPSGKACAT